MMSIATTFFDFFVIVDNSEIVFVVLRVSQKFKADGGRKANETMVVQERVLVEVSKEPKDIGYLGIVKIDQEVLQLA